ncbi:hypothetical protein CLOACE_04620 [Clostridium acetireducens DSM 10703]|uniref:CRISPR-associated protein Cas6 C-terminal domain-containing protein n=1 Tax=Clostridium acetireducens DSM 10703 TaxID=1121290 RepID=A0A1E8F0V5_9CLOT|nr:hypothetical protein [Clostridium acetireducens]OFI07057.1 hypothetical protein CLOACE_04620 [Clostridium acetireducens DSM 10703]
MKDIQYCILDIKVVMEEDSKLSKHKSLMLAGALINEVSKVYCVNNNNCTSCFQFKNCFIQKILGGNYKGNLPVIVQSESIYSNICIVCDEYNTNYKKGDTLKFSIYLYNDANFFSSQLIYFIELMGEKGIGKNRCKFKLDEILNDECKVIYKENQFFEENLQPYSIKKYIDKRLNQINGVNKLVFVSPFYTEYFELFNASSFNSAIISYCIAKRLNSLNALEKEDVKKLKNLELEKNLINRYDFKLTTRKYPLKKLSKSIKIYSYNKECCTLKLPQVCKFNYYIKSFLGNVEFHSKIKQYVNYLIAGEKLLIGCRNLIGFGKYVLKEDRLNE